MSLHGNVTLRHVASFCILVLLAGCSDQTLAVEEVEDGVATAAVETAEPNLSVASTEGAGEPDDVVRRRQATDFKQCLGTNGHGSADFELLYTYGELTIEDLRQWYPGEFDDVDQVDFSALRNVPEWAKTAPLVPDQIVNDCLVTIGGSPTLDIDKVVRIEPGLDGKPGDG